MERATYEEIDRLKSGDVPATEIEKAKRQIEASLVLSSEEPLQQAMLLGQYETIVLEEHADQGSRGYSYLDTLLKRINEVTAEEVAAVSQRYLTEDSRTVGYLINEQESEAKERDRAA